MRRKTLTNIRQKELVYGNLRSKIDSLIEAKKHRLKKRRRGNELVSFVIADYLIVCLLIC